LGGAARQAIPFPTGLEGIEVKKITERLKVARAEHKIALKAFNMAQRRLHRVLVTINTLEKKHELAMAQRAPVKQD
jgi:hypothetical protein